MVTQAVLDSCDGSVETAIASLLDMGSSTPRAALEDAAAAQVDADEELALALFRQFAEEMESEVPADVRNDPDRYEAFARERYDQFVDERTQQGGNGGAPSSRVFKKL